MYESFSNDYDRFVNWENRLKFELPFLERELKMLEDRLGRIPRLLDTACGTGMHAITLAQRGYPAAGADLFEGMIERSRANASAAGVNVHFETAGFGTLAKVFGPGSFDVLLCLGNSLPHVLTARELAEALADFAACLAPGGLLVVQNRNFDALAAARERWMEPQSYREAEKEWLFIRFYDYLPDGLIDFNILTLRRDAGSGWLQQVNTARLRPLLKAELSQALAVAGFDTLTFYGSLAGEPFNPASSGNLVLTAQRR